MPRGARAASSAILAGAKPTHDNAFKLPLVERTLSAVLADAKPTHDNAFKLPLAERTLGAVLADARS